MQQLAAAEERASAAEKELAAIRSQETQMQTWENACFASKKHPVALNELSTVVRGSPSISGWQSRFVREAYKSLNCRPDECQWLPKTRGAWTTHSQNKDRDMWFRTSQTVNCQRRQHYKEKYAFQMMKRRGKGNSPECVAVSSCMIDAS